MPKFINEINQLTKEAYDRRQDYSEGALQILLGSGYSTVTFVAHPEACDICQGLNGTTWDLAQFLAETQYAAPLFSHVHVQCRDELLISGDGLEDKIVDGNGLRE